MVVHKPGVDYTSPVKENTMKKTPIDFINEQAIAETLEKAPRQPEKPQIGDILGKAAMLKGLNPAEIAVLMNIGDSEMAEEMFKTARAVKQGIYGDRIVLFAPMYISNLCKNECLYCAFRRGNKELERKALTQEEIEQETKALLKEGHKRILMVAGESYTEENSFDYILDSMRTLYNTKEDNGNIRRVNVNLAPLSVEGYKKLLEANVGTCQIFQETYHRETYGQVHLGGPKADYDYRLNAFDRAMKAGIGDVGMGALLGLCDWKFELLAMKQHAEHLEQTFGVGPHTISVPRIEKASGSDLSTHLKHAVSDNDFKKLVAILRLAVPYTGIIMSTRENPQMRRTSLGLGVSQISAGSRTHPGGYAKAKNGEINGQFQLGDHRSLNEVMLELVEMGFIPSFCVGCELNGRMGRNFMEKARSGVIQNFCTPNGLSSFQEWLSNYTGADSELRVKGEGLIDRKLETMRETKALGWKVAASMVERVRTGNEVNVSI
jgi:2-iminoacetate synthase